MGYKHGYGCQGAHCAPPIHYTFYSRRRTVFPTQPAPIKIKRTMGTLPIALILSLSACTEPTTDKGHAAQSSNAVLAFRYRCKSGKQIQVSYPGDGSAIVNYESRRMPMTIAVSASGTRYIGDDFEWWSKGSGEGAPGTLFYHREDSAIGRVAEQCTLIVEQGNGPCRDFPVNKQLATGPTFCAYS